MSTETAPPRRLAVVLARHAARDAAPPGIDPGEFAAACLADTYEVLADLVDVRSGIAGGPEVEELLWPGALRFPTSSTISELARLVAGEVDELVVVAADAPDLPGLVLAKLFKGLRRLQVCAASERRGLGWVAIGVRVPAAPAAETLDLDQPARGGQRPPSRVSDWHRLRRPGDARLLDPGLEGWESTRALLARRVAG